MPNPHATLAAGLRLCADALEAFAAASAPLPPEMDDEGLTPAAAAKKLGISDRTVYALVKRKELRAIRIGRAVRIPARELELFRKRRME